MCAVTRRSAGEQTKNNVSEKGCTRSPVAAADAAALASVFDLRLSWFAYTSRCFVLCAARHRLAGEYGAKCEGACALCKARDVFSARVAVGVFCSWSRVNIST